MDSSTTVDSSEARAASIDVSAELEAVYSRFYGSVWRYGALSLRNTADADELVQEVFERALRALLVGHGPQPGLWQRWLLLVARRLAISRHRRRSLLSWLPLSDTGLAHGTHSNCFEEVEMNLWLDQATSLLPPRQREALFLRYLGDMDDADVGAVLGISPSGVRSLVSRAIAGLREHPELWK
jgi:RNA polymerase sigma factor (sigma-70 family)